MLLEHGACRLRGQECVTNYCGNAASRFFLLKTPSFWFTIFNKFTISGSLYLAQAKARELLKGMLCQGFLLERAEFVNFCNNFSIPSDAYMYLRSSGRS